MQGYSPKIPYTRDTIDGFSTNKTALETIRQDLKMLLLTNPGERMMNPDYGIGIRRYLFEQKTSQTNSVLISKIQEQTNTYMNFVTISNIDISDIGESENSIYIKIEYYIPTLNAKDQIDLSLATI